MFEGDNLGEVVLSGEITNNKTPNELYKEKYGEDIDYSNYEVIIENLKEQKIEYKIIKKKINDKELEEKIQNLFNTIMSQSKTDLEAEKNLYQQLVQENVRRANATQNSKSYSKELIEDIQKINQSINDKIKLLNTLEKEEENYKKQDITKLSEKEKKSIETDLAELEKRKNEIKRRITKSRTKKNAILKDYEMSKDLGISYAYYKEIENVIGKEKIREIMEVKGLSDIVHKNGGKTKEEMKKYDDARRTIFNEIIEYQKKSSLELNDVIKVLYGIENTKIKGTPKIRKISEDKLNAIKQNANNLEQKQNEKEEGKVQEPQQIAPTEENTKRSIDEIKVILTDNIGENKKKNKLHPKNVKITKTFADKIKQKLTQGKEAVGRYFNNVKLFVKGTKEMTTGLFEKLGMKLIRENKEQLIQEISDRIDKLSNEDKETLFDEYLKSEIDNKYAKIYKMVIEQKKYEYYSKKEAAKYKHDEELQQMLADQQVSKVSENKIEKSKAA